MKKLTTWYRNLLFRQKVLMSFLVVSLIPVIILGTFSYLQTRRLLIRREKDSLAETLNQSVITLNSKLETYETIMENIAWDTSIQQMLSTRYQNNYEMYLAYRDVIDPVFFRVRNLNPQIQQLSIYSGNTTLHSHGSNLVGIEQLDQLPFQLDDYKIHWKAQEEKGVELYCRAYPQITDEENVAYLAINYESVFENLKELFQEDYGVLIVDQNQKPVFSYFESKEKIEQTEPDVHQVTDPLQMKQFILEQREIPVNQWNMYLYRPLRAVSRSAFSITVMVAVAIVLCLIIVVALSLALTGSVVKPLRKLIQNMDMIEDGNFAVDITARGTDEIGLLIGRFGEMVQRLNHLVNEVYKSKITQQAYEMRALQAQINPHFLYNSLSLINWKAIMAGQDEISEMTQLLSTYYRTTLNKGKNVTTVKSEWDNTCSYARIQNLLHSGRLQITTEIEDEILQYQILNLTLQPLVENAIAHGLDHKTDRGDKNLWITGRGDGDHLIFTVEDNGCGIPKDLLNSILTSESKGYGIQNVHHRIQLYYGDAYGLSFDSEEGKGTRAIVKIPKTEQSQE